MAIPTAAPRWAVCAVNARALQVNARTNTCQYKLPAQAASSVAERWAILGPKAKRRYTPLVKSSGR
ncbi:hypothetical protein EBZ39_04910 [bacterium]|nr:hypothetical protein [bacterium]